ncbi:hypothetical protein, partial [Sulfuricurvum sp.]|uniref:hypothetical protein n=1 Tax=Sulfuricurvum sp. TaxID=2025608 RepID=UPI003561DBC1
ILHRDKELNSEQITETKYQMMLRKFKNSIQNSKINAKSPVIKDVYGRFTGRGRGYPLGMGGSVYIP